MLPINNSAHVSEKYNTTVTLVFITSIWVCFVFFSSFHNCMYFSIWLKTALDILCWISSLQLHIKNILLHWQFDIQQNEHINCTICSCVFIMKRQCVMSTPEKYSCVDFCLQKSWSVHILWLSFSQQDRAINKYFNIFVGLCHSVLDNLFKYWCLCFGCLVSRMWTQKLYQKNKSNGFPYVRYANCRISPKELPNLPPNKSQLAEAPRNVHT